MGKANEFRVSITLNRDDPLHRTAILALENQGRRKSQFVVNAISHYMMDGTGQAQAMVPEREAIREICKEEVRAYVEKHFSRMPERKIPPATSEEMLTDDMEILPDDLDFTDVSDALDSFRRVVER